MFLYMIGPSTGGRTFFQTRPGNLLSGTGRFGGALPPPEPQVPHSALAQGGLVDSSRGVAPEDDRVPSALEGVRVERDERPTLAPAVLHPQLSILEYEGVCGLGLVLST